MWIENNDKNNNSQKKEKGDLGMMMEGPNLT